MGNLFQNVTAGVAELKNFYQGPIVDQLSNDLPAYRACEYGKHPWSGKQVVRPIRTRRNQGIGATSDGGNLPTIGRQNTKQAQISAKYNYLRFGITGPMIKASQSNAGSFVRSAAYELETGYEDLMNDENRQLGYDGSGYLARLNAAAAATSSITIKGREDNEPALKFVDIDLEFDIITSAGAYKAQRVKVDAISSGDADSTTATLTLDQAVTASADDYLIRAGSKDQEVQGLLTLLDGATTTVYNIDRSENISFQGNYIDKSTEASTQLTLDFMQRLQNEAQRRGGKLSGGGAWLTDFDTQRMYQKLLTADKRYSNTMKGDGGFANGDESYLEFNGLPIVPDKDFPPTLVFMPKKHNVKYVLSEMEFADETGSMYIAQTDKDQLEVRVRHFFNHFNEKPSASARGVGYTSP